MDPQKRYDISRVSPKSIWRENKAKSYSFYCPLCKSPRKVPLHSRPGGKHVLQIVLATAFFVLAGWNWFGWKGGVAIVPLWAVFEVVYRLQFRAALLCHYCGFDPFLYLVDVKRARREVESHWRKRFEEHGIPFPEKNKPVAKVEAGNVGPVIPETESESSDTEASP